MDPLSAVDAFRHTRESDVLNEFVSLLALDNVTGDVEALHENADEIVRRLRDRGCEARAVARDGIAPVVVGRVPASGSPARRLGMYAHYDGQPVDPAAWTTPPFQPTIRNGRVYARGSADDKAPIAALLGAIDALREGEVDRSTEVVFLFEGQEESGSPDLGGYLGDLADELAADLWLICDGPVHPSGRPQVVFGVRGFAGFELTVFGPERELHSGHFGNWVPNPVQDLAALLATCKDTDGRVVIDGFYDSTRPITDGDRALIAALPEVEAHYREDIGFAEPETWSTSHAESLLWPTFNVRGIHSADIGDAARNVIPRQAMASVDMRLAAGNDPEAMLDLVARHFRAQGYHLLDRDPTPQERRRHRRLAKFVGEAGYPAARVSADQPGARAIAAATATAGSDETVLLPTFGGSVPLHLFNEYLGSPVVLMPIANYDNNQHAANENLRIDNLWYGVRLWSVLLAGSESVS